MLDLLLKGQANIIENFEKNKNILDKLGIALTDITKDKYEFDILFVLLQDKIFGSKYSRISLKKMKEITEFSRNKINNVIKIRNKTQQNKSNPVIYEIKDNFIEELLYQNDIKKFNLINYDEILYIYYLIVNIMLIISFKRSDRLE